MKKVMNKYIQNADIDEKFSDKMFFFVDGEK